MEQFNRSLHKLGSFNDMQDNIITALVVEDDLLLARMISGQLREAAQSLAIPNPLEIQVLHAVRMSEAITLINGNSPDVVLLDLTLPDSAGLSTLELLSDKFPQLPIVVMTGDDNIITSQLAIHLHAQEFLVKGEFSPLMILRAVLASIERKKLQHQVQTTIDKLESSQQRYFRLLEFLPEALCIIDNHDRIIYCNAVAEGLFEHKREDLLGQIIPIDFSTSIHQTVAFPLENGQLRYIRTSISSVYWDETMPNARMLLLKDDPDSSKYSPEQAHNIKLLSFSKILGGIAHDLNNLLSPVLLGVQTLSRSIEDEKQLNILRMIEKSSRRGSELIRNVMNYTTSSTRFKTPTSVKFQDVLDACLPFWKEECAKKSITLQLQIENTNTSIPLDSNSIEEILYNILTNAIDASPNDSTILLESKIVEVDEEFRTKHKVSKQGTFHCVSVTDNGIGIASEHFDHVFEPFFTTKDQRSGLGLYIVSFLLKQAQGFMTMRTSESTGTYVAMYFPLIIEKSDQERKLSALDGRGKSVLVLDNEATIRELLANTLTQFNFSVYSTQVTEELLALTRQYSRSVQCVIIDINARGIALNELIDSLHAINPQLHCLIMSGMVESTKLANITSSNYISFLPKPLSEKTLLTLLENIL